MKTWHVSTIAMFAGLLMTGCTPREKTGRGFALPPGDEARGKATFVQLKCNECHVVSEVTLPAPSKVPEMIVELGGEVSKLRSYGDLVTSIIHPSQRISDLMPVPPAERPAESPMPNVNDTMTVSQLVDLTAFLHPRYKEIPPIPQTNF